MWSKKSCLSQRAEEIGQRKARRRKKRHGAVRPTAPGQREGSELALLVLCLAGHAEG